MNALASLANIACYVVTEYLVSTTDVELGEWLKSKSDGVQLLALEFPAGTTFLNSDGILLWLVGYTDGNALLMSPIDPHKDYDAAAASYVRVEANDVRNANSASAKL